MKTVYFLCITAFLSHCKARNSSKVSAIGDPSAGRYLDLSMIENPALLKQVCQRRDFYIFVGNGEAFGQVIPRPDLTKEDTDYLSLLASYEKSKEQWYFGKITNEYESLKKALASADASCIKAGYVDSRIGLIGILDGPGIGDSRIEVSTFDLSQTRRRPVTIATQWDARSSRLVPRTGNFELLMPRDVELILKSFDQDLSLKQKILGNDGTIDMVVPIFKGHSVEVRPTKTLLRFSDALELGSNKKGLESLHNLKFQHTSLLDFNDTDGPLKPNRTTVYSLVWSPGTVCGLDDAGSDNCKQIMKNHLAHGFQSTDMQGCRVNFLKRLTSQTTGHVDTDQGDIKQGDIKQGDIKQGDIKQGEDGKQGETDQGGKGFAIAASDYEPSHYLGKFPLQSDAPIAIRAFGEAVAIDAKPGSSISQMRNPVHAATELMLLDTCSMDLRSWSQANWLLPADGTNPHAILAGVALANPMPLSADAVDYSLLNASQYAYLFLSTLNVLSQHRNEIDGHLFHSASPDNFAADQRMMNSILNRSSTASGDNEFSLRILLRNMRSTPAENQRQKELMLQLFSQDLLDQNCNLQTKLYRCSGKICPMEASFPSDSIIDEAILRQNNQLFSTRLRAMENTLNKGMVPASGSQDALEILKRQSSLDEFPGSLPINPGMIDWLRIQSKIPFFWRLDPDFPLFADKIKVQSQYIHELREFHSFYSLGDLTAKPDPLEFLVSSYKIHFLSSFGVVSSDNKEVFAAFLRHRDQLLELVTDFYDLYAKKGLKTMPERSQLLNTAKQRTDRWNELVTAPGRSRDEVTRDLLRN